MDFYQKTLELLGKTHGELAVRLKVPLETIEDLSIAYTPGIAEPCRKIAKNPDDIYKYTVKGNMVAVVTDGSAVLGLGNIGAAAALPVMEGKCALFKRFGNVDAFPICVQTQDIDEFVRVVKNISTGFGGINLEDIAAPRCFEIENRLKKELSIPVFHDDQHGTAIVVLAAIINALKVVEKQPDNIKIAISGAGAGGTATAKLLVHYGIKNIILCDREGAIYQGRPDLKGKPFKAEISVLTNPKKEKGSLETILKGADVFIGVSTRGLVSAKMVTSMAEKPIVFAMANPDPEITAEEAKAGGAYIVGTGRSDFPNQINNVLAFPGVFRGVLDVRAAQVTNAMKLAAAKALSGLVRNPSREKIIPNPFDPDVAKTVADGIKGCC